jgi:hypothetical protein
MHRRTMEVARPELIEISPPARTRPILIGLLIVAAFVVSHTLAPLYASNQNTKFVIGMARAGAGNLNEDYLAHTTDPFPLFTQVVYFTQAFLTPAMYYVYAALLMGLYVYGMFGIAKNVLPRFNPPVWWAFAAVLILVHAAVLRYPIRDTTSRDVLGMLQDGWASQYILGPIFQPSMFGVLLLCAIRWYMEDRLLPCVLGIGIAAAMHPSYVLISVMLAVALGIGLLVQRRLLAAGLVFVAIVALALPMTIHLKHAFAPTDPQTYEKAQDVLAYERIPHHMLIMRFFRGMAVLQIVWVILAILLARKSQLMLPLAILFGLAIAMTLATEFAPELLADRLREIQPWRATAWAIPVATGVNLAFLAKAIGRFGDSVKYVAATSIVLCVIGGGLMEAQLWADETRAPEWGVMQYVRAHGRPGELYLVPVNGQDPTSFIDFRLHAQAATYATFKSHPNKDVELLEWHRRYWLAETFYDTTDPAERTKALDALLADQPKPTHIIVPVDSPLDSARFQKVWGDKNYMLYQVLGR